MEAILNMICIKTSAVYITMLNNRIMNMITQQGYCTLRNIISNVHDDCDELKQYCESNQHKFKISTVKDKGLIGKIVEFQLFGNLPNSDSRPDMDYGDIKTTHFKKMGENKYNAKERLTITNFGDPTKEENIKTIADKDSLKETKYYSKMQHGIIVIFRHESEVEYNNIEDVYNKKILGVVHYNLDTVFETYEDIKKTFDEDYDKIKKCIIEGNVSQAGQTYLHIHKHGCKNGMTRAFGFTNRFLTRLVSIQLNLPLIKKGKSEYIEFQ